MLIGRKVDIPAGTSAMLVDADDFEGAFEVVIHVQNQVWIGDSSVAEGNGLLWNNGTLPLTLHLNGEDSVYGAAFSSTASSAYILAYSV